MSLESRLQVALLLALPARLPSVRFFRRNVGAAKMRGNGFDDRPGQVVRFAIKGQCDLYGITQGGRHLEVELKAAGKRLEPDQVTWAAWCTGWKVPHIVLTGGKGETVEKTVERWVGELEELLRAL